MDKVHLRGFTTLKIETWIRPNVSTGFFEVVAEKTRRQYFLLIALLLFYGCGEKETLRICFTGDIMFDRGIRQTVEMIGYDALLEEFIDDFSSADYTIVNMESPVTSVLNPRDKKYVFRSDPECLRALKEAGVTHLNLANNHSMDQGNDGFRSTIRNIQENGLIPVGTSLTKPELLIKGQITAALFSVNWIETDYITTQNSDSLPCIAPPDSLVHLIEDYNRIYPGHHIIVMLHWGIEYMDTPENEQINIAHALIDSGADAVIGHHPHVIQPSEDYKKKPIYYSLGNLIFDQPWVEDSGKCFVLEFH